MLYKGNRIVQMIPPLMNWKFNAQSMCWSGLMPVLCTAITDIYIYIFSDYVPMKNSMAVFVTPSVVVTS